MVVVINVSSGFVTATPTGDPAGSAWTFDGNAHAQRDISDATATTITEVGWYNSNASPESDYDVGLYSDVGDSHPQARLELSTGHAKGTAQGWKSVVGLNWTISGSTNYWIAGQLDNMVFTSTDITTSAVGQRFARYTSATDLTNPWTDGNTYSDRVVAVYAVWVGAATGTNMQVNIGDAWKAVPAAKVNIGDAWKDVASASINIGDAWKTIF